MKKIIFVSILFLQSQIFAADAVVTDSKIADSKTTVAYFGKITEIEFNEKIKPIFHGNSNCKTCEIVNWTPYDVNQKYDEDQLQDKISQLKNRAQIVFFDWNDKATQKSNDLIPELQKLKGQGQILVASAGVPSSDDKSCPLYQTLFGKIDDAIIVGELIQNDILWPKCFFGPEMLTAIRPPRDQTGKGIGPLIFVARFAGHFNKRKPEEWASYLKAKKAKTKRIWPEVEEFFPR